MKELLAQSWKRALGSENVQNCEANEMTSVIVGLARLYNPWRKEAVLRLNNGETPLSHSLTMYLTIPMPSSSRPTRGGPPFEPVPEDVDESEELVGFVGDGHRQERRSMLGYDTFRTRMYFCYLPAGDEFICNMELTTTSRETHQQAVNESSNDKSMERETTSQRNEKRKTIHRVPQDRTLSRNSPPKNNTKSNMGCGQSRAARGNRASSGGDESYPRDHRSSPYDHRSSPDNHRSSSQGHRSSSQGHELSPLDHRPSSCDHSSSHKRKSSSHNHKSSSHTQRLPSHGQASSSQPHRSSPHHQRSPSHGKKPSSHAAPKHPERAQRAPERVSRAKERATGPPQFDPMPFAPMPFDPTPPQFFPRPLTVTPRATLQNSNPRGDLFDITPIHRPHANGRYMPRLSAERRHVTINAPPKGKKKKDKKK
ncbi:hypothetical protein EG328_011379 [Venturia inaequalis]|uniref:Uncharacterized protein n=1 Tax=Venturia inaequalis TaxID=5025 RepID=A0A8H3UAX8_VENIN|nr:hypothetical protein EG328_011379 [Venturia inaequalis]KAE9966003.1 hypothetical protein EG327_000260 [Venturia inaequalis]